MGNALLVRRVQPLGNLNRQVEQFVDRDGGATYPLTRPANAPCRLQQSLQAEIGTPSGRGIGTGSGPRYEYSGLL
jgi:hypothetical protein